MFPSDIDIIPTSLELRSNDKASDLQQAVHKLLESHAIEVSDPSSTRYYSRLFLPSSLYYKMHL